MAEDRLTAWLDAVEDRWFHDGDLGLTIRKLGRVAGVPWTMAPFSARAGLLDAMFERATGDLMAMSNSMLSEPTPALSLRVLWLWLLRRPALAVMLQTGAGPEGRKSEGLDSARARLECITIRSQTGTEAFHGLVAGDIGGRLVATDDERMRAIRAVLAMGGAA